MGSKDWRQWLDGCFHGRAGHGKNTHIGEREKQCSSRTKELLQCMGHDPLLGETACNFPPARGLVQWVLQPSTEALEGLTIGCGWSRGLQKESKHALSKDSCLARYLFRFGIIRPCTKSSRR